MPTFKEAALTMFQQRGWLCIPLTRDSNGFPKRPFTDRWTRLSASETTINAMPWQQAHGLGIILGPVSQNLAAIDIDGVDIASYSLTVWDTLIGSRSVQTIRKRAHIYVQELVPSTRSTRFEVTWDGTPVTVELKAVGTQVAAPPTPGYSLFTNARPFVCENIQKAWELLCVHLEKSKLLAKKEESGYPTGYPKPWQDSVDIGDRNNSAYVEAHALREAKVPYHQAVSLMRDRVDKYYTTGEGMAWEEIEQTIKSAYVKGVPPDVNGRFERLDNLFPFSEIS